MLARFSASMPITRSTASGRRVRLKRSSAVALPGSPCIRSTRAAMSARLMFSPCAPIGGTTCAASATSAVRGPLKRSAIWLMIGHSVSAVACVSRPSTPAERALSSAPNASRGRARRRAISGPRSIHTTPEACRPSRSGSGTSVNGPPERWTSVETLSCGRSCVTAKASAFWP